MRIHSFGLHNGVATISWKIAASCALGILLVLQPTPSIHADEITAKQFLDEAPPAWARYQTFAETLSGSIHFQRHLGEKVMADSRVECKASGQNRLADVQAIPALTNLQSVLGTIREGNVYGKNRAYSFRLKRPDPQSPWLLVDLSIPKAGSKSALDTAFDSFALYKREAICVASVDLSQLVQAPNFRILKITPVPSGNELLQEVTFSNTHKLALKPYDPVQAGTLLFDPKHEWCLRGYKVAILGSDAESVTTAHFDYEFNAANNAIPKQCKKTQVIQKWLSPNAPADMPKVITAVTTYDLDANRTWPEKDFTLTAYGLPEPPGTDWRSPTPWYIWVGGSAILLIIVGGIFTWLKRRAMRRAG